MTTMRVKEQPGAFDSGLPSGRLLAAPIGRRLVVTDAAAVFLAILISLRFDPALTGIPQAVVAVASLVSSMAALAACRTRRAHYLGSGSREFTRVIASGVVSIGVVVLALAVLDAPLPAHLIAQCVGATLLVLIGRFAWRVWLVRRRDHGDQLINVLIAGEDPVLVARRIALAPAAGLNVVDVRDAVGSPEQVVGHALAVGASMVVLAVNSGLTADEVHDLRWQLEGHGIGVMIDTGLVGADPRRLELWSVDDSSLVRVSPRVAGGPGRWAKAAFDRGCAFIGLVLLAPLLGVVAALVKLEDGGDVFFRQTRVGEHGQEFQIVKFRTMSPDAEERVAELRSRNDSDGPLFKMKDDPRVTRVGRVLRKYSIDELPQLWNVLVGEMSLVGPRPALPSEVAEYGERSRRRLTARPGITGLWQVSGRSDLSWDRGVRLDTAYIDNWSLMHDGLILARTVRAVVRPRGAY